MPRIDLFTSPECPSCPRAREVLAAFAARHPEIELREWDLTTDPGPAVGRGIFATPSLLLNGADVLFGVPTETQLLEHFSIDHERADGVRRVLVLNAYADFLRRPVFETLSRAGYVPFPVESVEAAARVIGTQLFAGVVVALNPELDAQGDMVQSGIGLWAQVLTKLNDAAWAARPILVTATSRGSAPLVRAELERHAIRNPVLIATKAEVTQPDFSSQVRRHLDGHE